MDSIEATCHLKFHRFGFYDVFVFWPELIRQAGDPGLFVVAQIRWHTFLP